MQAPTFSWEVKDLLTQFLNAFDGAIVKRYNDKRVVRSNVGVRYVYAPKQRTLHDIVNKAQHITLPAVSFWMESISRDPTRVFNKLEGNYYNKTAFVNKSTSTLQPLPVNIDVAVSIMTRYQTDMDEILSNFVPYCDPYFIISWSRYEHPELEIRTEVLWNNDLKLTYPIDLESNKSSRVICDTKFTIKGWMFKSDELAHDVNRIYRIDSNFYAVSAIPTITGANRLKKDLSSETVTVSAVPSIKTVNRWLSPMNYAGKITAKGPNLGTATNILLSANYNEIFSTTTTFNAFSGTELSATYPALTGVTPAQNITIIDENTIEIDYPTVLTYGFFDIYAVNEAGYTKMTETVYIANATQQFPYINGVEVVGAFVYDWSHALITWDTATFEWRVGEWTNP